MKVLLTLLGSLFLGGIILLTLGLCKVAGDSDRLAEKQRLERENTKGGTE